LVSLKTIKESLSVAEPDWIFTLGWVKEGLCVVSSDGTAWFPSLTTPTVKTIGHPGPAPSIAPLTEMVGTITRNTDDTANLRIAKKAVGVITRSIAGNVALMPLTVRNAETVSETDAGTIRRALRVSVGATVRVKDAGV
jgi:hypothetical protein